MKVLIQNGADVNAVDCGQKTALRDQQRWGQHLAHFNYSALVLRLTRKLSKTTRLSYFDRSKTD